MCIRMGEVVHWGQGQILRSERTRDPSAIPATPSLIGKVWFSMRLVSGVVLRNISIICFRSSVVDLCSPSEFHPRFSNLRANNSISATLLMGGDSTTRKAFRQVLMRPQTSWHL